MRPVPPPSSRFDRRSRRWHALWKGLFAALALLALVAVFALPRASAATTVFINEIHYDNTGTDTGEAIEIAGPAGTDLTGWSLVLYNGSNGLVYNTTNLSGILPNQQNGYGTYVVTYPTNGIQNGSPDGMALVAPGNVVVQFLSYEGTFTAVDGPAAGLTSADIGVSEGSSTPVGYSLQLTGQGTTYEDFLWTSGPNTFGAVNLGQTFGGPSGPPQVALSEIRIDQPGADNDEYFELTGAPGTPLQNFTYIVIGDGTGGSGVIEEVTSLDGFTLNNDGFFVVAESTFSLGTADHIASLNFENSDNVTHLLVWGFTGADGDDLDVNDDGVLDNTPWTTVVDCVALVETPGSGDLIYCDTTVGPDGNFVPAHVYRCDDGWHIGAFDPGAGDDTPGTTNACGDGGPAFGFCGDPATPISAIQGSGMASPDVGNIRVIEGVVTGDFQASDQLGGFFVQEEPTDEDGDPTTSEGIFVFDDNFGVDVHPGDLVRVRGQVAEFFDLTELTQLTDLVVCASGYSIAPTAVTLPVSSLSDWEAWEGMLVTFPQTLYVTDNYNQGRYGEVELSVGGRLFVPTNEVEPGPAALALQDLNDRSRIQLDDGSRVQNPPTLPYFEEDNTLRGGDTIVGLTGALGYSFGSYEIQPTQPVDFTRANPRPLAPADVGGSVKVASMNVYNYFTTLDENGPICGPLGNLECRGADNAFEFQRQRAKLLAALSTLNADVVGLMELENNQYESIADLVNGLNDMLGPNTYAYIDTGTIGTDAIKVGLIYKPAVVTPLRSFAILDSSVDPGFLDTKNRPALAQTFQENASGEVFTVIVNHLKSKGSPCDDVDDPDVGDGQGNCNLTRTRAAQALVDWLTTDPTGSNDPDFLIIGDLNAYAMEDPIDAIEAGPDDALGTADDYTDLIEMFVGPDAYSFVFFGQAGYLDHALASPALVPRVTGVTEWHINADEPRALDYNDFNQPALYQPNPFRSSDHDPVLIGLCEAVSPVVNVTVTPDTLWPPNHKMVTVSATVSHNESQATVTLLGVTSNEPDNGTGDGDHPNDIVVVDDYTFQLRAERSGHGDGRVYTVTYQVTDACGNTSTASAEVRVPKSKGQKRDGTTDTTGSVEDSVRERPFSLFLPAIQR